MFRLSICADTVFRSLPFVERVKEIARAGFLVEFWRWMDREVDAIAADPNIRVCAFTGYLAGSMVHPEGAEELLRGMKRSLPIAAKLRCGTLFLSSGELTNEGKVAHRIAEHPATMWITAYKTLCQAAELAEKHNVVYCVEHLNTKVDHAGYPFPRVEDVVRLITEVGSPRIRILLDIYHTQIQEGNLIEVIRDYHTLIGHIHVADVPGRHELGTGEIDYTRVARTLREVGYEGVIGLEAFPQCSDAKAVTHFREIFQ
jgi:hydroxypyruvate isomerase